MHFEALQVSGFSANGSQWKPHLKSVTSLSDGFQRG